jgi:hypothetical protein
MYVNKPMTADDIADSCEKAAELIEGNWCQGAWLNENRRMCIEGGLIAALGLEVDDVKGDSTERQILLDCPVYSAVTETLNEQISRDSDGEYQRWYDDGDLPNWNDASERTEQDVLDLLHATAKRVLGVQP